jgi:uncharacterized RDD family membrane protein YckC
VAPPAPSRPEEKAAEPEETPRPISQVIEKAPDLDTGSVTGQANPWQEELSKRVEGYRQRRARLRSKDEASGNLDLDFDAHEIPLEAPGPKVIDFPLNTPPSPRVAHERLGEEPLPEVQPAHLGELPLRSEHTPAPAWNAEVTLGQPDEIPPAPIVVESPSPGDASVQASPVGGSADLVAKIGPRFMAGLLDVLVLLAGAGVFTLIFWRTGGRLSRQPLDLAVVSFMACLFILLYFGVLAALTFSTPGLTWMGLEIRRHNGQEPSVRDAFWRALGCLISAGALMLGFLWALLDSDGLTWHDRMSGTFITPSRRWHPVGQPDERRV